MRKVLLPLVLFSTAAGAEQIGSVDTVFKLIGPDHKIVVEAYDDSPASRAGLRGATQEIRIGYRRLPVGGDVILQFQGKPVNSVQELATEIDRYKPGDKVTVTVLRNNRKVDVPITLEQAPRQ